MIKNMSIHTQVLKNLKEGNSFSVTLSGIGEFYAQGNPIHESESFTNAEIGWILQQWVQRALYKAHPIQFKIENNKTYIYEDIRNSI